MPATAQAEECFQQALTIARRQQARAWELRAAMSLSHLWQQQGKRAEAYALLAPVYGWFTEGFDTADLQEAQALFDELSCAGGSAAGRVAGHSMATTLLTAPQPQERVEGTRSGHDTSCPRAAAGGCCGRGWRHASQS